MKHQMKSPSNDRQMRQRYETQEVNQSIDDNSDGVNEDMFVNTYDSNGLELGSVIREEPEDNCVNINISSMINEMYSLLNSTSKPSTAQSSQEMVNKDIKGKSSEESNEQHMRTTQEVMPTMYDTIQCSEGVSVFRCLVSDCLMIFTTEECLHKHLDLHTTDPTIECGTDGCIDMFHTRNQLNRHWLKTHSMNASDCKYLSDNQMTDSTDKVLRCDVNGCDYHTCNESIFKDHVIRHKNVFPTEDTLKSPSNDQQNRPLVHKLEVNQKKIQKLLNSTSKPSTSQSSQEMVNIDLTEESSGHHITTGFEDQMKSPSNDQQMRQRYETQEVNQSIDDNNHVNEHMFAINGLELGTVIKEEPEDYSMEPINTQLINKSSIGLMNTEMQTQVNSTSKPLTSQLLQDLINQDMNRNRIESMEMLSNELMSKFLRQNKSERKKCFDLLTKTFICPINKCHKSYETDFCFTKHLLKVHASRHYVCTHEGCGKVITDRVNTCPVSDCQTHSSRRFSCGVNDCPMIFTTRTQLREHWKLHETEPTIGCGTDGCIDMFYTESQRYRHQIQIHKIRDDNQDVNQSIDDNNAQNRRPNHSDRKYVCTHEGCGKALTRKHDLKRHQLTHKTVKSFHCPHNGCQYKAISDRYLKEHLKTHSTDRTDGVNICPVSDCQMAFKAKNELNVRRLTHGSGPAIKCGTKGCNEMFYTFSQRLRHRVSVHNRRTHSYRRGKQWFEWKGKTETQEVMQTMDDNNTHNNLINTGMETQVNTTSKSSISQSSLEMTNEDMSRMSGEKQSYQSLSEGGFKFHMKKHSVDIVYTCGVDDCPVVFKTYYAMHSHQRTQHGSVQTGHYPTDQSVHQSCNQGLNEDIIDKSYDSNGLELGSMQRSVDNCVEPMNTDMSSTTNEMQTHVNSTSKPSTSQSSQDIVNIDLNEESSEDSMQMTSNQMMSQLLRQNKTHRCKYFDRTLKTFICPINKCHKSFLTDAYFTAHLRNTHI
ncbi:unnamed protein product [Medioppia subpectinata]|uniref:C2H2-type domain-containing protein n=1 Tax=Medioppia subpectinata TaxID=1979941 RepID=A0A7R9Q4D0_9ACAR|nr:unnamed protein product [Medioppia subpectinata]CAG2111346.1 unnamed protein product [Medioppia subpectinata]